MLNKLKYKLLSFFFCFSDAAEPWQFGLQDPATSVVELSLIHISEPTRPY